jgi:hypothetical protein
MDNPLSVTGQIGKRKRVPDSSHDLFIGGRRVVATSLVLEMAFGIQHGKVAASNCR